MKKLLLILLCLGLVGCATVKGYSKLEQPENKVLTASIGSSLFRVNKSADLPNVFGKADLYGGKVDKGYIELKLKGITEDGNLMLQVVDQNLSSSETTMDRYRSVPRVSVDNKINIGDDPSPDKTVFEFDPKKEKSLIISGVRITFIEVKEYSVVYKLSKEQI